MSFSVKAAKEVLLRKKFSLAACSKILFRAFMKNLDSFSIKKFHVYKELLAEKFWEKFLENHVICNLRIYLRCTTFVEFCL